MAPFDWSSFAYAALLLFDRSVTYKRMFPRSLIARLAYENLACVKPGLTDLFLATLLLSDPSFAKGK